MNKTKLLTTAFIMALSLSSTAWAERLTIRDIEGLPPANFRVADEESINSSHWAYKTLQTISEKYGLALGNPNEKFNMNQPLSRNDAAVLLVSITGKIEKDKVQLTEVEKDRISILQQEFDKELKALTGRVGKLETTVDALKGSVSKVEKSDASKVGFGFGENIKLTGAFQARYTGYIGKGTDTLYPNFRMPLAEIGFKGKLAKNLNFVSNFQPSRYYDGSAHTMMSDVYISTDIIPHNTVYFGQSRVPIGVEGTTSGLKLDLIDLSQIARNYSNTRDIGIKVAGDYKYFDYYVGAFNGSRYNSKDSNTDMDIATWFDIKPLAAFPQFGKATVGAGYTYGKVDSTSTTVTSKSYDIFGFYADYKYKKAALKYEWAFSDGAYAAVNRKSSGWYLSGLYDVTPKTQLVLKMDRFDPDRTVRDNLITEYSIGTNYFMSNYNLKFQVNAVIVDNPIKKNSSRLVFQSQYSF